MHQKKYFLYLFLIIPLILYSKSKNREVVVKTTSLFALQNDKEKEISVLKKLFKNRKFTEAFEMALVLKKKSDKDLFLKGSIESRIILGEILKNTGNYKESINYFREVLEFISKSEIKDFNKEQSEKYISRSLILLASSFQRSGQKDSAKYYYNKLINFSPLTSLSSKAKSYTNLASICGEEGNFEDSKKYFNEAIKIYGSINDKVSESATIGNLANIYLIQKNYKRSKKLYFEAIELIEKVETTKALTFKEDLYYNLAFAMYKLKDYKAYDYQEKSYLLKDTLGELSMRAMIKEISDRYDFEAKKEIFSKEEEVKRAKLERNNWIIGITGIVVALLIVFLNALRQKNLKLKLARSEFEKQSEVERVKSETQIQILNATIDAKEAERKQIAEVLHDNVSTLLSSANLHLQASQKQFKEDVPTEIQKTKEIILEASQKVRNLSHNLISSVLLKFGLEYAVKDMANKYSNSELTIKANIKNLQRQEQEWEIKLYNVIQELTNNIIKHSKAACATVSISEKHQKLFIEIKDNGVGFEKDIKTIKTGIGLNQIDARIKMMNGTFSIEAREGTIITIIVPSKPKKAFSYD